MNRTVNPVGKVVIYRTTRRVENPIGDGRHNRAQWRSELDKTTVAPGFIFGVDEAGNIFDYNTATHSIPSNRAADLRMAMLAVASPPLAGDVEVEETVESVLASIPGGASEAVTGILNSLGISPKALRELLAKNEAKPTPSRMVDITAAL